MREETIDIKHVKDIVQAITKHVSMLAIKALSSVQVSSL